MSLKCTRRTVFALGARERRTDGQTDGSGHRLMPPTTSVHSGANNVSQLGNFDRMCRTKLQNTHFHISP